MPQQPMRRALLPATFHNGPGPSSLLSKKTVERIRRGLQRLNANPKRMLNFRIVDKKGLELGEASGATKPQALLNLYRHAMEDEDFSKRVRGVRLAKDGRALVFKGPGPFPENVSEVRFQRVA